MYRPQLKIRFIGLDTFTDKCRLPHYRPPHHACHPRLSSSTSQRNFVIDDTDWMGIIFHRYNKHSYSYAPYKSVRMQTINISNRERSQSTHKVPKRRRLAPSWDVVDDRPPHQLVHGVSGAHYRLGGYSTDKNVKVVRMTALDVTGDIEACL